MQLRGSGTRGERPAVSSKGRAPRPKVRNLDPCVLSLPRAAAEVGSAVVAVRESLVVVVGNKKFESW